MHAGIDFLEFKPSEIALAVAISISREFQTPDMNKAILSFPYMEKVIQKELRFFPFFPEKTHFLLIVLNICFMVLFCRKE